jgi:hypothetical protein
MNKAVAVKTLTEKRERYRAIIKQLLAELPGSKGLLAYYRRQVAALSVAINALTGKTAKRRGIM